MDREISAPLHLSKDRQLSPHCGLVESHPVQPMTKRQNPYTKHGIDCLAAVVRKRECARHNPKAKPSDGARHHEPMLHNPAAKRDSTQQHGKAQTDFMDQMRSEQSARGRHHPEQHRRREAMHETKA